MEKPAFIGRGSLERTARLDDERRWVGFAMDGEAPVEGSPIRSMSDSEIIGNVTGSWTSPLLGKALSDLTDLRIALRIEEGVKLLPCVAKDKESVKNVLLELLYSILEEMDRQQ